MRDKIKILVVEPMKPCEVREIPDTLEAMAIHNISTLAAIISYVAQQFVWLVRGV